MGRTSAIHMFEESLWFIWEGSSVPLHSHCVSHSTQQPFM